MTNPVTLPENRMPPRRVLCASCGQPIKLADWGTVRGMPEQWFHTRCWKFLSHELAAQREAILALPSIKDEPDSESSYFNGTHTVSREAAGFDDRNAVIRNNLRDQIRREIKEL